MLWNSLSALQKFDVYVVHAALLGQTVFLVMWAVLPWWRSWVGRALMIKSVSLWLLFTVNLTLFWVYVLRGTEWRYSEQFALGTHIFVFVGVWSQVVAIGREMRVARVAHRQVTGTRSRDSQGQETTASESDVPV